MKNTLAIFSVISILGCQPSAEKIENRSDLSELVIAFGSCNREDLPQVMWPFINKSNPDVWIWLGDNMYGDSPVKDTLVKKYNKVLAEPGYQELKSKAQILATWDDHDYGKNDGGVEFEGKEESQQAFLDFLDVSVDDPRRKRRGVYSTTSFEAGELKVKVILLDSRYHRDSLFRIDGVYQTNNEGTVLGEEQWKWLEHELTNSGADINIIGNGIQYLAMDHRFEKWANFPNERKKLTNLISRSETPGVILISGDRHIAEVSEMPIEGLDYPLRDITASGLTHSYEEAGDEKNRFRISPLVSQKNYGLLHITKSKGQLEVKASLEGLNDTTFFETTWLYN